MKHSFSQSSNDEMIQQIKMYYTKFKTMHL